MVILMGEKNSKYYDEAYENRPEYNCLYNESYYMFIWEKVVKMLSIYEKPNIIELGCGTGQFAHLLQDRGYINYVGYDFSEKGIKIAREMSNQHVECRDIRDSLNYDCDVVICLETLEHVEKDKEILKSIPRYTDIIFSVPKFNDPAHVRYFENKEDVFSRYDLSYVDVVDLDRFILCRGYND